MSEHYTRDTASVTLWCNQCGRATRHLVSDGRVGRCDEHQAPNLTKKQQKQIEQRSRRRANPSLFSE